MIEKTALRLLNWFFQQLYHRLAWSYDLVADLVSGGLWRPWVLSIAEWVKEPPVLELGFGPGHLQAELLQKGIFATGLDESAQMCRQTQKRLARLASPAPARLVRGRAQQLPFGSESFPVILSTFPSEYAFDPLTLSEVHRVLTPQGKWIILLSARLPEKPFQYALINQILSWVGYYHPNGENRLVALWTPQLEAQGFRVKSEKIQNSLGYRLVVEAQKP